jgi:hypothetical protein
LYFSMAPNNLAISSPFFEWTLWSSIIVCLVASISNEIFPPEEEKKEVE